MKLTLMNGGVVRQVHSVLPSKNHDAWSIDLSELYDSEPLLDHVAVTMAAAARGWAPQVVVSQKGDVESLAALVATRMSEGGVVLPRYAVDLNRTRVDGPTEDLGVGKMRALVVHDVLDLAASLELSKTLQAVCWVGWQVEGVVVLLERGIFSAPDLGAANLSCLARIPFNPVREEECGYCQANRTVTMDLPVYGAPRLSVPPTRTLSLPPPDDEECEEG